MTNKDTYRTEAEVEGPKIVELNLREFNGSFLYDQGGISMYKIPLYGKLSDIDKINAPNRCIAKSEDGVFYTLSPQDVKNWRRSIKGLISYSEINRNISKTVNEWEKNLTEGAKKKLSSFDLLALQKEMRDTIVTLIRDMDPSQLKNPT